MKIPATREHVLVDGQTGLFLVIWVDLETGTAQVVPVIGGDQVSSVPFAMIGSADEVRGIGNEQ